MDLLGALYHCFLVYDIRQVVSTMFVNVLIGLAIHGLKGLQLIVGRFFN